MKFAVTFTGTTPLLLHNSRLANPLDPIAKAMKQVTSKKSKTDADHDEIARIEHMGSLYWDKAAGPYLPADNFFRCIYDAAKKNKKGPGIKEGVFIVSDINPIAYQGPRDIEGLWADEAFRHIASAKVGMQRVQRCRPVFRDWAVDAEGILDEDILGFNDLQEIIKLAGNRIGIGDWRPRFGRFVGTIEKV